MRTLILGILLTTAFALTWLLNPPPACGQTGCPWVTCTTNSAGMCGPGCACLIPPGAIWGSCVGIVDE